MNDEIPLSPPIYDDPDAALLYRKPKATDAVDALEVGDRAGESRDRRGAAARHAAQCPEQHGEGKRRWVRWRCNFVRDRDRTKVALGPPV